MAVDPRNPQVGGTAQTERSGTSHEGVVDDHIYILRSGKKPLNDELYLFRFRIDEMSFFCLSCSSLAKTAFFAGGKETLGTLERGAYIVPSNSLQKDRLMCNWCHMYIDICM